MQAIKDFAESVKSVLLYILAPLAFIAGFVYYVFSQNQLLKKKLATSEAEKELGEVVAKTTKSAEEAKDAVQDYRDALGRYKRGTGESGDV